MCHSYCYKSIELKKSSGYLTLTLSEESLFAPGTAAEVDCRGTQNGHLVNIYRGAQCVQIKRNATNLSIIRILVYEPV